MTLQQYGMVTDNVDCRDGDVDRMGKLLLTWGWRWTNGIGWDGEQSTGMGWGWENLWGGDIL